MEKLELLLKKIHRELSDEETVEFQLWLDQSKDNQFFFDMLESLKGKGSDLSTLSEIDIDKAWNAVLERQKSAQIPKKVPLFKKKAFRYAVAASIILLVSLSFLLDKKENQIIKNQEPTIVNNTIVPGTDKATLTLEDGSNIALEKGQSYHNKSMNSDGEKLVYTAKSDTKPEIAYNFLTIPRGGQFFVKLSDGTQVWLNSESKLKYPVVFVEGETREVELVYGEAYFDVSASTNHNGASFKIISQGQDVEVLGTEFNIKAYRDEASTLTTLAEGKVIVGNDITKKSLLPGQQSTLDLKSSNITIAQVDVYNETSWRHGIFSFEGKSLKEIMKVLSRWYDMEVVFVNPALEDIKFVGVLSKDQHIEDILSIIKNLKFINSYEINKKTIVLK